MAENDRTIDSETVPAEQGLDPFSLEYALMHQNGEKPSKLKGRVSAKSQNKTDSTNGSRFNLKVEHWDMPRSFKQLVPVADTIKQAARPDDYRIPNHIIYEALPPIGLQSDSMPDAYKGKEKSKYNRGIHQINATIDLNGDHFNNEGDLLRFYWLRWSIPVGLKGSITGPICYENDNGDQIPTKDWYSVEIKRDEGNIWAEGFVMHFDESSHDWIRFNKLKFMFDTEESVGPDYGKNPGSCWTGPALEKAPVVMADVLSKSANSP